MIDRIQKLYREYIQNRTVYRISVQLFSNGMACISCNPLDVLDVSRVGIHCQVSANPYKNVFDAQFPPNQL